MSKICPRGPILDRIGPRDRGRKPSLTCGDAVEPPIGIEPMTYSLRVAPGASAANQKHGCRAWPWALRCGAARSDPGCG